MSNKFSLIVKLAIITLVVTLFTASYSNADSWQVELEVTCDVDNPTIAPTWNPAMSSNVVEVMIYDENDQDSDPVFDAFGIYLNVGESATLAFSMNGDNGTDCYGDLATATDVNLDLGAFENLNFVQEDCVWYDADQEMEIPGVCDTETDTVYIVFNPMDAADEVDLEATISLDLVED